MAAVGVKSVDLREQGNKFYGQAQTEGMAPAIKRIKLEKAVTCYNEALREASDANQQASATKNIAVACRKMILSIELNVSSMKQIEYYFKETMSNFELAISYGRVGKPQPWVDQLQLTQEECVGEILQLISDLPFEGRIRLLNTFAGSIEKKSVVLMCYSEMARILFQHAVVTMENKDFKGSLYSLKECYHPIEEMKRLGADDPHTMSDARVLDEDVILHTASAESYQAIVTGDELLEKAVMESEDLKMSLVMEVLDWYMKAVMQSRGIEIEFEAMASSRIGKVYDKVLKMPCNAKKYFMHSITLAHSLAPKNFVMHAWYRLAQDMVKKYQHESLLEVQKREEEERQKHLKEMQAEVKILNGFRDMYQNQRDHYLLLVNIYKRFPPKNPVHSLSHTEAELKQMEMKSLKKVFLKACTHYHPDKQDATHGMGWKFFSAEISKVFTSTYGTYKCC